MRGEDEDFSEALAAVFGERASDFSGGLRDLLHDLWTRAIASRYRRLRPTVPEDSHPLRIRVATEGRWEVAEGEKFVATVTAEDGQFVVWHAPPDPAMMAKISRFRTLEEAFAEVAAFERGLRTKVAQSPGPAV